MLLDPPPTTTAVNSHYCEQEGTGPQEDKLTLACFNSGDVPELIGRLSVALSHATHKVISLPMFRKDLGVSSLVVDWLTANSEGLQLQESVCFWLGRCDAMRCDSTLCFPGAELWGRVWRKRVGRRGGERGVSEWEIREILQQVLL